MRGWPFFSKMSSMIEESDFWRLCDELLATSEFVIDRPKGSRHPRYPEVIYPVDYGYLKNTTSMDGGGIDIFLGTEPNRCLDAIICTVDLFKCDSEIKLLIGCSENEKRAALQLLNEAEFMKGLLIRRS